MIAQARSITEASGEKNIKFCEAPAEHLPFVADGSVDMVVAGQAAHWFDYPRLWPEMVRVLRPGGTLAFWGYKDHVFVDYPNATRVLNEYAYGESKDMLGPYWAQPGRSIVQNKLRDVQPPQDMFEHVTRIEYEPSTKGPASGEGEVLMQKKLSLKDVKGYFWTWSSYHGWKEAHPEQKRTEDGGEGDIADRLFVDMVASEDEWKKLGDKWPELEVIIEWGSGVVLARKK